MGIFNLPQTQLTFFDFGRTFLGGAPSNSSPTLEIIFFEIVYPYFIVSSSWVFSLTSCNKLAPVPELLCTISSLTEFQFLRFTWSAASNFKVCSKVDFHSVSSSIHTTYAFLSLQFYLQSTEGRSFPVYFFVIDKCQLSKPFYFSSKFLKRFIRFLMEKIFLDPCIILKELFTLSQLLNLSKSALLRISKSSCGIYSNDSSTSAASPLADAAS